MTKAQARTAFKELTNSYPLKPIHCDSSWKQALDIYKKVCDYVSRHPKDAKKVQYEINKYLQNLEKLIEEYGLSRGFLQNGFKTENTTNQIH